MYKDNFVHQELKVDSYNPEWEKNYEKEKYILKKALENCDVKTIYYEPDYEQIVEFIINKYRTINEQKNSYYEFVNKNKQVIINIFKLSDTNNVKNLRIAVDNFAFIFKKINEIYANIDNKYLVFMLMFTLASTIEVKAGRITYQDLIKIRTLRLSQIYLKACDKTKIETLESEKFVKKYFNLEYLNDNCAYEFIINYIFSNNLDIFKMKEEIDTFLVNYKIQNYKKILIFNPWELEDKEFEDALHETIFLLESGDLGLSYYFRAYIVLNEIKKAGLLSKEVDDIIFCGLNQIEAKITHISLSYEEMLDIFTEVPDIQDNEFIDRLKKVRNKIVDINNQILKGNHDKEIINKVNNFTSISDLHNLGVEPYFHFMDIYGLLLKINTMTNKELHNFYCYISDRYSYLDKDYKVELENLKQLSKGIDYDEKISSLKNSLKKLLKNEIDKAITKINNEMPQ